MSVSMGAPPEYLEMVPARVLYNAGAVPLSWLSDRLLVVTTYVCKTGSEQQTCS